MSDTCAYCGQGKLLSIAEIWSDHNFQLETCCEHLHDEVSQHLAADPKEATALLRRLNLEGLANLRARRVVDNGTGSLVLDWQIAIDSALPQKQARAFVSEHHRHCPPPVGWKFGACIRNGQTLIGVIMVGRPVARMIDSQRVLEVNRLCNRTDVPNGLTWNACSMAYGWAAREAKKRGFEKIITYTLEHESGASLKAAGWVVEHRTKGRSWSTPGRARDDKTPTVNKLRWTPASMALISVSMENA